MKTLREEESCGEPRAHLGQPHQSNSLTERNRGDRGPARVAKIGGWGKLVYG